MQFPQSTLPHYSPVRGVPYSTRNPNQRSTQPRWQPFPLGMALGELAPLVRRPAIGETDSNLIEVNPTPAFYMLMGTVVLVRGALGYQAGKAMAPSGSDGKTWGWMGVPIGLFGGTIGLGLMGVVSLASRR